MVQRAKPIVPEPVMDELLAGADLKTAFSQNGLFDRLKKALATGGRLTDVANHLLRHGVQATVDADIAERDGPAADQLLDVADRRKADLIVAGAYGHSRCQEWVFGGFTRALLAQTARAVLFSH